MPHSANSRWPLRSVALPLLLSLALHGLLFLALWFWPARTRSPLLSIESTRITLDTCVLDSGSPTLLPERELPPDLLGPHVDTALAPRLEGPPPAPTKNSAPSEPRALASGSPSPLANARGSDGNLFPLPASASSVVYVLDRSLTMAIDRKLDFARQELIASLRRLPPTVRFQVIDYNDFAESLVVDGQRDLLQAEPAIVEKAVSFLFALEAAGATNHFAALRRGLDLHPDVLYFLTDADDLKPEVISAIAQRNQHTIIHTIELTRLRTPHPEGPLYQLATNNRGTYRRVVLGD
jgi:hypothetical protein